MSDDKKLSDDVLLAVADRVNEIRKDVQEVKVTMARNTASLEEHMRRTELLEKQVEPLRAHVTLVNNILRIIGFVALCAGAIDKIMPYVRK